MALDHDIQRSIDLLALCQALQSEKDGVDRPTPGRIDKTKTLDQFAQDIDHGITILALVQMYRGLEKRLRAFALAHPELVEVGIGDSYSESTLDWLERTYPASTKITK